ncbi:cyclopropane-fatty-acyl-phospholipid synthase family protein [Sedimentibacter sp.]|uniref:cyclopropane-fatty-acyl-phospholipid synthase family protein n=1 Tax=Sedimentibacter sp. TaxID=1960295 RepID=UPI0028B0BBB1|nr:cyclopropane-fatty-acyl-phospholipid synthase family protein [Sedimentibacter sp.]
MIELKEKSKLIINTDKIFYKSFLKNIFHIPFEIRFWDGEEEKYGEGDSKFKLIFNCPLSKTKLLNDPSLALGEAYMTNEMDIDGDLQNIIEYLYQNKKSILHNDSNKHIRNNIKNSKDNVHHHYDIGNEFYKLWLDDTMTYSCGYFKFPWDSLNDAQKNKRSHILRKLNLNKGQTLLDIGCGWGELILTAAKEYNVKAMGITLSSEQFNKVKERIKAEGLEKLVEVELLDYRELKNKKFDRIVSVGMIEHVGKELLPEYFTKVKNLLDEDGISLLHCITGINGDGVNSWINKYIFPGGYIPTIKELITYMSDEEFYLLDVESLRRHYGRTLEHWSRNFENALPEVKKKYDDKFIRMWRLYLNGCAASFNSGNIDIHQFLFTKGVNNNLPWTREYIYLQ